MVKITSKTEKNPPKTNTFKRDSFKENRSSNVFSFKTTNRYLSVSFCLNLLFFVFFLAKIIVCGLQIYNEKFLKLFSIKIHFVYITPDFFS